MLGAGAVGTVSALKFVQDAMLKQLVIADAVSARASLLADRLNDPRDRHHPRPERGSARHQPGRHARLSRRGL